MTFLHRIIQTLSGKPRAEPHRAHPVDLDRPQELLTQAGDRIWVSAEREGVTIYARRRVGVVIPLDLHHTEAQWLLKAIRQQNNIVKQRLGAPPYDEGFSFSQGRAIHDSIEANAPLMVNTYKPMLRPEPPDAMEWRVPNSPTTWDPQS